MAFSVAMVLVLASCQRDGDEGRKQVGIDLAADAMPFDRPVLEPLDSFPDAPPLPEGIQQMLDLRRAFFAGDHARLDAAITAAHDQFVSGAATRSSAEALVDNIEDTRLAGIDSCAAWLQARPDSYPAHWLCGAIWHRGAWQARGTKYANEVSAAQFALMNERLQRSNALLQRALELTPKPLNALILLAGNHFLGGDREMAESYLQRAGQIMPQYVAIHSMRMNFSLPEWGGSREALLAQLEIARTAGVSPNNLLYLEDQFIARPWKLSTPGAERAYWEQAIRKQPLRYRLDHLVKHFVSLRNWHEALPVANRLLQDYPDSVKGYYRRARIHEGLGRIAEARDDYRMAAAMGDDDSLQTLIMAHIRGGLGLPGKSFEQVTGLCRYGATLGSPVGTNCLGASFFEGGQGMPFRKDLAQAFAWHLMSARAGHFNSQYDLGWLLYTGRGPGLDPAEGKRYGIFWMRRAAEQDHEFAKRKLEENKISRSEVASSRDPDGNREWSGLTLVYTLFEWLIRIFG